MADNLGQRDLVKKRCDNSLAQLLRRVQPSIPFKWIRSLDVPSTEPRKAAIACISNLYELGAVINLGDHVDGRNPKVLLVRVAILVRDDETISHGNIRHAVADTTTNATQINASA